METGLAPRHSRDPRPRSRANQTRPVIPTDVRFKPGARVGDYEILSVLGIGGMGQVYKVRNTLTDRVEAMKVLLPSLASQGELAERFLREIKVSASLLHPNIATLLTAQRIGSDVVMVMEFVDGQTLEFWMRQTHIPLESTLGYIDQVLQGLSYAHSAGIVHRDVKPANLQITDKGQVKILDLGIARVLADPYITKTGQVIGSLHYMSPEQIEGKPDVDGRSDQYSVGITLYEAVTGKRPFDGESNFSIMAAHMQSKPRAPIELDPAIPRELNDVILKALAKDPAERYQTAEEFRVSLAAVRTVTAPASTPATPVIAAAKPPGNRRVLYVLAGSLATIAVLVVLALQVPKFVKTRAESETSAATAQQAAPTVPQNTPATEQAAPTANPVDAAANQRSEAPSVPPQTSASLEKTHTQLRHATPKPFHFPLGRSYQESSKTPGNPVQPDPPPTLPSSQSAVMLTLPIKTTSPEPPFVWLKHGRLWLLADTFIVEPQGVGDEPLTLPRAFSADFHCLGLRCESGEKVNRRKVKFEFQDIGSLKRFSIYQKGAT